MNDMPTPPVAAATSRCWNCQEALQAGSVRCLFCGVQQEAAPTAFLVAPTGAAPAALAGVPSVAAATPRVAPRAAASPLPRLSGTVSPGPAFSGSIAGGARRVAAFTVDVLVVAAVAVVTIVATGQLIYAALALLELGVALWVLEARTGLTFGNALLRLRASRDDAPYSPGIGRSFVRSLVTGIGFLALGAGAWVVVASSGWDSARRGRSWADRAAHTLVVAVPRRERVLTAQPVALSTGPLPVGVVPVSGVPAAVQAAPGVQSIPGVQIVQQAEPVVLAAPQVISTAVRPSMLDENSASASSTGVGSDFVRSAVPVVSAPVAPMSRGAVADGVDGAEGTLLLIFDTGQREQLTTPVSVNLGRKPTATEPTDKLIIIADPESTVSKNHVRLEHSRGSTWVIDGGSTNGTDLLSDDGDVRRLSAGERVLLEEGTRIRVGNRAFTVSIVLGEKS